MGYYLYFSLLYLLLFVFVIICIGYYLYCSPPGRLLPPHQLQVCLSPLLNMVDCPGNLEGKNICYRCLASTRFSCRRRRSPFVVLFHLVGK